MFQEIVIIDYKTPIKQRANARKRVGPYKWLPISTGNHRGFYSSNQDFLKMDRAGSTIDLRLELANDHVAGSWVRNKVYYLNPYATDDILEPIIARLPHSKGYLAGWVMGKGMSGCLENHVYFDIKDAANAAHALAHRDAQESREVYD